MEDVLNTALYPLDKRGSEQYATLVERCKLELDRDGICNLEGFMHPEVAARSAEALRPLMSSDGYAQKRYHNIYFKTALDDLPSDHPALQQFETKNLTLCCDQIDATPLPRVYEWPPLRRFLTEIMGKDDLYTMQDPLARVNVMSYGDGDALSWHFDRSEFTCTLLLQAPAKGGVFEYRTNLRTADDPNYDGVASLLRGEDPDTRQMSLAAGTLNVFRGINTPHRVTAVEGDTTRMIAVFAYFDRPGVRLSGEEQMGFYGRAV